MTDQSNQKAIIDCPRVFFSSENNVFLDAEQGIIEFDKVNFKAKLNNYGFTGNCLNEQNRNIYNLDILILAEPINPKKDKINLPIFVLLYDFDNKLIDKQYFRVLDNLKYNDINSEFEITEVIGSLNIFSDKETNVSSITIGFVNLN